MAFEAGQLVGARFRLIQRIGEGALGEVWRASDRVPSRQVAIRFVTPNAPVARNAIDGFLVEMRTACDLRHRATARVIDVGNAGGGVPWFATELLRGESMEQILARKKIIPPNVALRLIAELAEAVAEAHALGLVHRGLHPRAVVLHLEEGDVPSVKLVDFGRERLFASSTAPETHMQGYRSVELSLGARETKESDVWALGVMLFRCITGRLPFATLAETTMQSDLDRSIRERVDDPSVLKIVRDCLRPARDERISAEELADRAHLIASTSLAGWNDVEKMVEPPAEVVVREPVLPALFAATDDAPHPDRASEPVRPPLKYEGVLDVWAARRKRALAALFGVSATVGVLLGVWTRRQPPTRTYEVHASAVEWKRREPSVPAAPTHCAATATAAVATIAPQVTVAAPPPVSIASATPPKPKLAPKPVVVTKSTPISAPPPDDDNPYE